MNKIKKFGIVGIGVLICFLCQLIITWSAIGNENLMLLVINSAFLFMWVGFTGILPTTLAEYYADKWEEEEKTSLL